MPALKKRRDNHHILVARELTYLLKGLHATSGIGRRRVTMPDKHEQNV